MNVFCSSHTMKSFPLLVPLAEAGRPPSENSLDSNPRPPLALLAGGGAGCLSAGSPQEESGLPLGSRALKGRD